MADPRPDLLAALWARIERYAEHRDPDAVLERGAFVDEERLLAATPAAEDGSRRMDLVVGYAFAWLYWYRYLARSSGSDREEARQYVLSVYASRQGVVPASILGYLSGDLPSPP